MKKLIVIVLILVLVGGAVFAYFKFLHVEDVGDAYLRTVAAAMLGDEELFLDGFTKESRPLVAGLLALSAGRSPRKSREHPYHFLVTEDIQGFEVEEDVAYVRVRRIGDKSKKGGYDVPMKKVEGTWKIDALAFTGKKLWTDKAR